MKCNKIKERLVFYDEGILSEKERVSVEEHLKGCSVCARELNDLRESLKAYVQHEENEPAPEPSAFLFAKISSGMEKVGRTKEVFVLKAALGAAFAFLLAVLASRFMILPNKDAASHLRKRAVYPSRKIEKMKNMVVSQKKKQLQLAQINHAAGFTRPVIVNTRKKVTKTARLRKNKRLLARAHKKQKADEVLSIDEKSPFEAGKDEIAIAKEPEIAAPLQPFIAPQENSLRGGAFPLFLNIEEIQKRQEEQQHQEEFHAAMLHIQMALGMNPANMQPKTISIMP